MLGTPVSDARALRAAQDRRLPSEAAVLYIIMLGQGPRTATQIAALADMPFGLARYALGHLRRHGYVVRTYDDQTGVARFEADEP